MKDQMKLLRDCVKDEIPAVVFQGDDACAVEILEAAKEIYQRKGCSLCFLEDWQLLINDFKAYQADSPDTIKLPMLKTHEIETLKVSES